MLRHVLLTKHVLSQPLHRQSTCLFAIDYTLFVTAGIGVMFFNTLFFGIPLGSGVGIVIGFATVGLLPSLDLSLEREFAIIQTAIRDGQGGVAPASYFPQTRKFALLACGIMLFVTAVLLLLIWRDISWLETQTRTGEDFSFLLRSVVVEVLFVMGVLLLLTLTLVFSYARNLKLLFGNQTKVLELVSQGFLDTKVPVVTNDEFGVIAGHTNFMIDRLVEREQMAQGLELARQIQVSLLPSSSPLVPGVQVAGSSVFCDETGGDFYDFISREGQDGPELVLMVGDVTGHGVGSALLMASVRAYLKTLLLQPLSLTEVMAGTNRLICRDVAGSGNFVTVLLLAYTPATRKARWVGAGHDPAVFHGSDGGMRELRGEDIPVGVDPLWKYSEFSADLGSGVLLLGTDGIWEAINAEQEMFGKERMLRVLREAMHLPPAEIISRILAAVSSYTGDVRVEDDRTLIIARLQ